MRRDSGVHLNAGNEGLMRDTTEMSSQYGSNMFHQPSPSKQQQRGYLSQPGSAALATSSPPSADDLFHSPPSSESQQMPTWHADALGASGMPFNPDMNGHDSQSWWSSPMPTRVSHAPSQHPYLLSPLPQKPTVQPVAHHNNLLQGGLMIQFDSPFDLGSGPESTFTSAPALHSTSAPHMSTAHHPSAFSRTHFMTGNAQQINQSRSPSMSPTNTTSPKSRAGKNTHRRTHSRKLSSNSTTAPKPATKVGASPKGAGANKSMNVSFVNFTPSDSQKILTGVAPSGSSKTKARREQEAREKRRKLSEAALMAVRQAGGDVEALEAVLC
jgi:hypothetical protein